MPPSKYRSANLIIQKILEGIFREEMKQESSREGIVKTQLIRYSGLKTPVAEKYLQQLENAGYISSREETWGDRIRIIYRITPLGKERFEWFMKINSELK